jgi:uncharacterized protein (DUF1810 family)
MEADVIEVATSIHADLPEGHAVVRELSAARKTSHWMWFIFPQLRGLGRTSTAKFYGIESMAEALDYWEHPVLGPRLKECTELVLAVPSEATARSIFGTPDDLKLRSCMTLYAAVVPEESVFTSVPVRYYEGEPDRTTLELLK